MRVITREQAKTYLGIADSTYDAQIDAYLPIIDAKVKLITGNRFNSFYYGDLDGTVYVELIDFKGEALEVGAQIEGTGIPADTYIEDVYYEGDSLDVGGKYYENPAIKLSNAATVSDTTAELYVGINIAYHPIIAKGIFWLIDQANTTTPGRSVQSRSMGPVSVNYGRDSEIDGVSGMPAWFVKGLPKYHSGV